MRSNIFNYAVKHISVCVKGIKDYQTNQFWFVSWEI